MNTRRRDAFSFRIKAVLGLALVALADIFFFDHHPGATLGVFALAWTLAVAAAQPGLRRDPRALAMLGVAAAFCAAMINQPTLLSWMLFWAALSSAVLLPRAGRVGDAWRWLQRLAGLIVAGVLAPLADLLRLGRIGRLRPGGSRSLWSWVGILTLPTLGGGVFVALFAAANPVIAQALTRLQLPSLAFLTNGRLVFWGFVLAMVWAGLRPRAKRLRFTAGLGARRPGPPAPALSIILSLLVFNALFAVQNGMDIAFLWSGAGLPPGVTLAEYAHRGAYPLVATALLAGLFVLVFLAPGAETARRPLVRGLVTAWVAQNVLLVVSSILRTLDYIDAYSLTRFRIAALAWMLLVGLGLVLIGWRLLRGRSAAWQINANAASGLLVLSLASVIDLGAVAAGWNVRHAREVGGRGTELDLCYLGRLGDSSLEALLDLEAASLSPELSDRVVAVRARTLQDLQTAQADWRRWTVRGAVRLQQARARLSAVPAGPSPAPGLRDCDGRLRTLPEAAPPAPLTSGTGA